MKVQTTRLIRSSRDTLWPLLTNSQMAAEGCFCLGVPKPVACELPSRAGGVGVERRCVSDRGTVIQTITEWNPPERLRFHMVSTDHSWGRCLRAISEDFRLEATPEGTRITRVTSFEAKGFMSRVKELLFWTGLKRVHVYVFRNWRSQAEHPAGGDAPLASSRV